MTAQEAYILAKAYTNKSIEGAGSLKGAACQIKSIEAITGGHRITFEWEDNDGEVSTDTMDVMDGADGNDGVGISSITYKETDAHGNYVYTVTLTDTNTYDIICPKGAQGETGATGETGNGIASIVKTSTAGLVDTYTITYTNGQTTTFTVTNGESITVDSAMSGSSTNPVQNKVITEALALKQNATDSNLQTTDDTIVGAINEHEGDIGSLKSGLTTLDNEVNGDATTYPYADVITIEDAVPSNLADCSVKIEPVQDLHGQSAPYVGGAGKNKAYVNINSGETSLTEIKDNDNNVIGVNADVGAAGVVITVKMATVSIENGKTYTLSGSPNDKGNNTYRLDVRTQVQGQLYNNWNEIDNPTITATEDVTLDIYLRIAANYAVNNLVFRPQIEEGSTATTFAPYTNICPISGHTEASVQRDGVNLFNKATAVNNKTVGNDGAEKADSGCFCSDYIPIKTNNTYYLSNVFGENWANAGCLYDSSKTFIRKFTISGSGSAVSGSYTVSDTNAAYIRINGMLTSIDEVQVELGSSATDYEPFKGKTYTIALGDTYYKGLLDVDTGVFTSYNVKRLLNDPDKWISTSGNIVYKYNEEFTDRKQYASDSYAGVFTSFISIDPSSQYTGRWQASDSNYFGIRDDNSLITLEQLKTRASAGDLSICYELATPFTVQLTPQQIQLLKGQNTLTASTGQISVTVNGVSGSIGAVQEQVNELASASGGSSIEYSTTEREIGEYFGKKLYEKSYILFANGAAQYPVTNNEYQIGMTGYDDVFIGGVIGVRSDAGDVYVDSGTSGAEVIVVFNKTDGSIYFTSGHAYTSFIAVVRYTKQTV